MIRKQKTVTHGLRYNAELNNRIEVATDSQATARSNTRSENQGGNSPPRTSAGKTKRLFGLPEAMSTVARHATLLAIRVELALGISRPPTVVFRFVSLFRRG